MHPQISIKVKPNNQITVTSGNFRKKDNPVSQPLQKSLDRVDRYSIAGMALNMGVAREIYERKKSDRKKFSRPPLDIIKKSQRKVKNPLLKTHKPKSFTRNSGQKIRESGAAMSIACGGDNKKCMEVTLTLPANHPEAFAALSRDSDYAINRLFQPIRRHWGKDSLWFFVWEYQKRGALHLHIALYNKNYYELLETCKKLQIQWHDILVSIGQRQNTCMFSQRNLRKCTIRENHQSHIAPIEKDIACYFSKYAGKEESKNNWYCQKYPVSRFWGSSRTIKNIIKENSFEFCWDYFANENEQSKKFEMIVQNILEKLNIVSVSSYSFCVSLKGKHRINHYKDGKKVISFNKDLCVAQGERFVIYVDSRDFKKALDLSIQESNVF